MPVRGTARGRRPGWIRG